MSNEEQQHFIDTMKSHAKRAHRAYNSNCPPTFARQLSSFQDEVARCFDYNNWSMFHRAVFRADEAAFRQLQECAAELGLLQRAVNEGHATRVMTDWVRSSFTPLVQFAFYDSEEENGFATESEDIHSHLADKFDAIYPEKLIERVALELEHEGPWGQEYE